MASLDHVMQFEVSVERKPSLTAAEKVEEAHGIWELAVARVAALAEFLATREVTPSDRDRCHLAAAVAAERGAFEHWQDVSRKATL